MLPEARVGMSKVPVAAYCTALPGFAGAEPSGIQPKLRNLIADYAYRSSHHRDRDRRQTPSPDAI